jgi:site-specific recombinase XerD
MDNQPDVYQFSELAPLGEGRKRKDARNRAKTYDQWLLLTGNRWDRPDLVAYADYLENELRLAPGSVQVHVSTIRSLYLKWIEDNIIPAAVRAILASFVPSDQLESEVDHAVQGIKEAVTHEDSYRDYERAKVQYLRLTAPQLVQLLISPNRQPPGLPRLRDRAVMGLLFATGIRENELCSLQVPDLHQFTEAGPALHVPPGRGCVERLVPYGDVYWVIRWVEDWLAAAGIREGPVFRGLHRPHKGTRDQTVRATALSPRAVENLLAAYPLDVDGHKLIVRPMDLRRANARLLHEAGFNLHEIGSRLGLRDYNAIAKYVGLDEPDASLQMPPDASWNPFVYFEQALAEVGL